MSIPEYVIGRYAAERAKRLRLEHIAQYVDFRDPTLASMDLDPYVDYATLNSNSYPLQDGAEVKVLIAGGGMSGLMTAHHLINTAGISCTDLVIVDKAKGFGGTWYWNRYPGVACDIESYSYLPLLEETGYKPRHRYSSGHEIHEQLENIAQKSGIRGQFGTSIIHQRWNEETRRWVITLSRNKEPGCEPDQSSIQAQFLVPAGGIQTSPHAPKLNSISIFSSVLDKLLIHTGRWDWVETGGSQEKPDLVKLKNKRVGIIGTGATAVQVAPHLAKWAKHTYIFQRTPSYVGPQLQKETTADDWDQMARKPGWQYERMASLDAVFTGVANAEDKIQDGWIKVTGMRAMAGYAGRIIARDNEEQHIRDMIELDYPWTEEMRLGIENVVKDSSTAESLKPWYPGFCKRPTFHPSYLSLFNQPGVTLVDTDGQGVEAYTPNGVLANGSEYELDVIILATGYTVGVVDSCPSSALNAPVEGRNGRTLKEKWEAEDYGTLYGAMTNEFPNLFFASGNGGSVSQNAHSFYNISSNLIAHTIKEALRSVDNQNRVTIEVDKGSEDNWSARIAERARWFAAFPTCTPGYLTGEGLLQQQGKLSDKEEVQFAKRSYWGEGILSFQAIVDK